jgi:predicted acetyltransferase
MKVRNATQADMERLALMGCESFPSGFSFEERIGLARDNPRYKWEEDVLVAEENNQAVAALITIPFKVWIGGARLPMLGVAGVRNALEARRQGYASAICIAAIKRAREQGYPISFLYPFRYDFYRKLGWGAVGEIIEYNFHPRNLPDFPSRRYVRRFNNIDLEPLSACYQRFVERGNCLIERHALIWKELEKDVEQRKKIVMVYDQGGEIKGYVAFSLHPGSNILDQTLEVAELIYDDLESYQGLFGFISSLRDQITTVRYRARTDERFHYILNDPRDAGRPILNHLISCAGQFGTSYMARVLNVAAALSARPNYNDATGTVCFKIRDEQVEENNRSFRFSLNGGKSEVTVGEDIGSSTLSLSIDLFSQIYSGAITIERAHFLGLLEAADPKALTWLDKAFRLPQPFLLDQF